MCECGTCYIGETGRSILERVKEHYTDLHYNRTIKSALAEHVDKTKHHILMDKVEILARCDKFHERRIREAIEIKLNPNNINRDQGVEISRAWLPIIDLIHKFRRGKII